MMSRPTVSIGYAEKNREVMTNFGLRQYCHRVDDIRPAEVVEDLRSVASRSEELVPQLRETNERYIRAVDAQFDDVIPGAPLASTVETPGT
jgi:polysaccharide pyruvyl transferase WcaK-like protein